MKTKIFRCRAGTGFSQPGIYGVAIVLGMELVGTKYRRLGAVVAGAFYAVGEVTNLIYNKERP